MVKVLSILNKLDNAIFVVQKILILIGVIAMVVINGAQVFCRYVIHTSLAWSEQTSVLLFFILIMLGANLAVKTDTETKIDILRFKNDKANATLHLITDVLSVVAVVVFLVSTQALLTQAKNFPQYLSSLKLDYYYIYLWLAVGFALVLIDKIINILKNICCICGITLPDYAQLDAYQSEKEADA